MSFMRTLASVAVGFAAAKGLEQYGRMGGMAGLQEMMKGAGGGENPIAAMMERFTGAGNPVAEMMPGGASNPMAAMMDSLTGGAQPGGQATGMAGLAGLMAAFQGAAKGAGQGADDMAAAFLKGTPAAVALEDNARLMIRAMIQAAKADGEIDASEQATILAELDDASPEERAFVEAELAAPVDPMRLATQAGDAVKAQIYATSLMAIRVDTGAERDYLDQVAQVLDLSDAARARIHAAMGVA